MDMNKWCLTHTFGLQLDLLDSMSMLIIFLYVMVSWINHVVACGRPTPICQAVIQPLHWHSSDRQVAAGLVFIDEVGNGKDRAEQRKRYSQELLATTTLSSVWLQLGFGCFVFYLDWSGARKVCACVHACMRACVRVCVCLRAVCVHTVCSYMHAHGCLCLCLQLRRSYTCICAGGPDQGRTHKSDDLLTQRDRKQSWLAGDDGQAQAAWSNRPEPASCHVCSEVDEVSSRLRKHFLQSGDIFGTIIRTVDKVSALLSVCDTFAISEKCNKIKRHLESFKKSAGAIRHFLFKQKGRKLIFLTAKTLSSTSHFDRDYNGILYTIERKMNTTNSELPRRLYKAALNILQDQDIRRHLQEQGLRIRIDNRPNWLTTVRCNATTCLPCDKDVKTPKADGCWVQNPYHHSYDSFDSYVLTATDGSDFALSKFIVKMVRGFFLARSIYQCLPACLSINPSVGVPLGVLHLFVGVCFEDHPYVQEKFLGACGYHAIQLVIAESRKRKFE